MEDLRESWGTYLRELRAERGWTLNQLEQLTDGSGHRIPRSRLSELERGEAPTVAEDIQSLSRVYGLSYGQMLQELMVRCPKGRFPIERTPEELVEEGKNLFYQGKALEAGWAFDAASQRAEKDRPEFAAEIKTWSAHAFEHAGANSCAQVRIEEAIDRLPEGSEKWVRACAFAISLYGSLGFRGRVAVFLRALEREERAPHPAILHAYILGARSWALFQLGNYSGALGDTKIAAQEYEKLGCFDRASQKWAVAALCHFRLGENQEAISLIKQSQEMAAKTNHVPAKVYSNLAYGEILLKTNPQAAPPLLEKALEYAKSSHLNPEISRAYELLEKAARLLKNNADARRWRRHRRYLPAFSASPPSRMDTQEFESPGRDQ